VWQCDGSEEEFERVFHAVIDGLPRTAPSSFLGMYKKLGC
jgi:hypothetical protein